MSFALRLTLPAEPFWMELDCGVRLKVRPPSQTLVEVALMEARRRLTADREAEAGLAAVAGDGVPADRLFALYFFICLGQAAIIAWEGIGPAEGDAPLPVTPVNIGLLMAHAEIGPEFSDKYQADLRRLREEAGKSAPAPNGTTAPAPAETTAKTAPGETSPAAGASAAGTETVAPTLPTN